MSNYTIGVKEFSDMIGADSGDVSRAITKGLIRSRPGPGGNRKGPGTKILALKDAEIIAAAVRCGISWQAAARRIDSYQPFKGGVVVLEGTTQHDLRCQIKDWNRSAEEPQRVDQA